MYHQILFSLVPEGKLRLIKIHLRLPMYVNICIFKTFLCQLHSSLTVFMWIQVRRSKLHLMFLQFQTVLPLRHIFSILDCESLQDFSYWAKHSFTKLWLLTCPECHHPGFHLSHVEVIWSICFSPQSLYLYILVFKIYVK